MNEQQKLSPDQARINFAQWYMDEREQNVASQAWNDGYCFGHNEMRDKYTKLYDHYTNYVAMQPAQPIKVDRNEITLSMYKMFIREKIKRDSQGKWWLKLKMWFNFLTIK